jgi:hypothetical protein
MRGMIGESFFYSPVSCNRQDLCVIPKSRYCPTLPGLKKLYYNNGVKIYKVLWLIDLQTFDSY